MTPSENQAGDLEACLRFREAARKLAPETFIVLGSGMSAVLDRVEVVKRLSFHRIPGLPDTSVSGHKGRFYLGRLVGRPVLISSGRLHYYEGHDWSVVTRPIEFAAELGVKQVILTNAVGGIRDDLDPGQFMPVCDQIDWTEPYPWRKSPLPSPYDSGFLEQITDAAMALDVALQPGVLAALTGPSYETPAEIRALREVGADAVGMSTTREVLAGVKAKMRCAAISLVTNRAAGLGTYRLKHDDVLDTGEKACATLADIIEATLRLG